MSLRGKDFRCELDPEIHEKLRQMADFEDKDLSAMGARLLEKAIVGEFHAFRVIVARAARSGITRKGSE